MVLHGNLLIILECVLWKIKSIFQALQHIDIQFFLLFGGGAIGLMNLYVYCYYGKMATVELEAYADCIYNTQWYRKPLEIQKSFVVVIAHTQRPLFYHGFGAINLNMETFLRLLKTVISYYFMFKTITTH